MWKAGGCDRLRRGVMGSCDAVAVPWVACSSNVRRLLAGSAAAIGDRSLLSPGWLIVLDVCGTSCEVEQRV